MKYSFALICLVLLLSGCGGTPKRTSSDGPPSERNIDISKIKNPVPKKEKKSRYGNPKSYVVFGKRYYVMDSARGYQEVGDASWYGKKFHGRRTSSGETYDMYDMTAAHKKLPLPTYVRVKNLENGRSIIVKVNDRGPFHENRIIDLSYVAALKLDIVKKGTARVEVTAIDPGSPRRQASREQRTPIKTPTTQSRSGFFIQAGSFSSSTNASNLKNKISDYTAHLVSVIPVTLQDKTWYRVLVGPVSNAKIANDIVYKLEQMGITEPKFINQ